MLLAEKNPKWDVLSEVLNEINNTEETLKIGDSTPGKLFTSSYIQNYVTIVSFSNPGVQYLLAESASLLMPSFKFVFYSLWMLFHEPNL